MDVLNRVVKLIEDESALCCYKRSDSSIIINNIINIYNAKDVYDVELFVFYINNAIYDLLDEIGKKENDNGLSNMIHEILSDCTGIESVNRIVDLIHRLDIHTDSYNEINTTELCIRR